MKLTIKSYHPVAYWKWDTSTEPHKLYHYASPDGDGLDDDEEDEDVCGICQNAYEGTCPECKVPGDDCPLITADRKPDKLPTTTDRAPVATVAPGPLPTDEQRREEEELEQEEEQRRREMEVDRSGEVEEVGEGDSMEVDGR
nr:uncharacterized protein CI109_002552 [Kwoniella shandongensis]KAA5529211.1 hypothetical protein CI109_002552 [Kwoniella shandongensis]